jgi:hypothetical protein
MSSKILSVLGTFALVCALASSPSFAAGKNHAPMKAMNKAMGLNGAQRKKCEAKFGSSSAHVKTAGKKAFMEQCMKQ